jgi:hypothetical protein
VLVRIEKSSFEQTLLQSVVLRKTVNFVGERRFWDIGALRSIGFESGSILTETDKY